MSETRPIPCPDASCDGYCECILCGAVPAMKAAGPWHKWPEERPKDAGRLYLVAWKIAQPSVMTWGGEGSWNAYSITHWAEILPPSEP